MWYIASYYRDLLSFDSGPTMESDVCGGMSGSKSSVTCCALSHNTTSWKPRLVSNYSIHTVNVERFAGLNIHGKVFVGVLLWCLGQELNYIDGKTFAVFLKTAKV